MTRDLRPMQQLVDAKLQEQSPEEGAAGNVPFFFTRSFKVIPSDSRATVTSSLATGPNQQREGRL